MIPLQENPFPGTLDSFEHQHCSGAARGTGYLKSNLTSRFLRTVAGAQADMLHRQRPRIFFSSVGNLLGDDAAQFIFAEIAGLSINLHGLCPGRYGESAKHRYQNNLPQEYLPGLLILMQQEGISKISSYFRTHLPILASFGLVATFDPGVTLLPAMYSSANWADNRKLDSG
jgi:hypothetical protein